MFQLFRRSYFFMSRNTDSDRPNNTMRHAMTILILTILVAVLGLLGYSQRNRTKFTRTIHKRQLTSEWHAQEEAKIDTAVSTLRDLGKWDDKWDKFSKLGDYGWRDNMDCGDETRSVPCMSGGYTFSEAAFEKLKRDDYTHDAHNTVQESAKSFQALIAR